MLKQKIFTSAIRLKCLLNEVDIKKNKLPNIQSLFQLNVRKFLYNKQVNAKNYCLTSLPVIRYFPSTKT